jgi:hypothetical protein
LKSEIPELKKFERILELTPADLTDGLLDKLTVIDYRKTFRGRCQACKGRHKPKANRADI